MFCQDSIFHLIILIASMRRGIHWENEPSDSPTVHYFLHFLSAIFKTKYLRLCLFFEDEVKAKSSLRELIGRESLKRPEIYLREKEEETLSRHLGTWQTDKQRLPLHSEPRSSYAVLCYSHQCIIEFVLPLCDAGDDDTVSPVPWCRCLKAGLRPAHCRQPAPGRGWPGESGLGQSRGMWSQ